jgi:Domain of unknown function (DUF4158)
MLLVRDYVGVKAWGEEALQAMQSASRDAARTLEDLADIINFALEQLVRQRFELPAFSMLHREAQHARAMVNREYQSLVCDPAAEISANLLEAAQLVPMHDLPSRQVELLRSSRPDVRALRAVPEKVTSTLDRWRLPARDPRRSRPPGFIK